MNELVAVKERPIIMTAESVRAILDGRKSQTRRVVRPQPYALPLPGGKYLAGDPFVGADGIWRFKRGVVSYDADDVGRCPYGQPGDRLWVREGWRWFGRIRNAGEVEGGFEYRAGATQRRFEDFPDPDAAFDVFRAAAVEERYQWRSPIHMLRWASRLTLEITGIRVEGLQEISEEDAQLEGVDRHVGFTSFRGEYAKLWDSLNAKRGYSWESSPWVWVIEFKRVES